MNAHPNSQRTSYGTKIIGGYTVPTDTIFDPSNKDTFESYESFQGQWSQEDKNFRAHYIQLFPDTPRLTAPGLPFFPSANANIDANTNSTPHHNVIPHDPVESGIASVSVLTRAVDMQAICDTCSELQSSMQRDMETLSVWYDQARGIRLSRKGDAVPPPSWGARDTINEWWQVVENTWPFIASFTGDNNYSLPNIAKAKSLESHMTKLLEYHEGMTQVVEGVRHKVWSEYEKVKETRA